MEIGVYKNGKVTVREATPEEKEHFERTTLQKFTQSTDQQAITFLRSMAMTTTTLTDAQALSMPDILPTWAELLERGEQVAQGVCLIHNGQCYRVVQGVTPIESQPPDADGMLAIYRPIDKEHAGTAVDPIPWVSGMDCYTGKYYSHGGKTYLCKQDMLPCVWEPGTDGLLQWEVVV